MSHFSLLAINFKNETELSEAMDLYDEGRSVPQYVSKTKQEIMDLGAKRYAENQQIIKEYSEDPEAATEKYGGIAKTLYENRNDPEDPHNFKDPRKFYEYYIADSEIDAQGNLLSTYNPNAKWDYWDIEETLTIGDIKAARQQYIERFDRDVAPRYNRLWAIIVEGAKPEPTEFMMLWGAPSKTELLSKYKNKEEYLEAKKRSYSPSYAVLTKNSGWYAPGTVGWWATSSATMQDEDEFSENYFKMFIDPYSDDTLVYRIDCHI